MILGVSHITLLSEHIRTDSVELQKLGYLMSFMEESVPDNERKHDFLARPSLYHSLAFYRHETGIPIELIMYDSPAKPVCSCFEALFDGTIPEKLGGRATEVKSIDYLDRVLGSRVHSFLWENFDTEICFTGNVGRGNGLRALVLCVKSLKAARDFWENGLGFRPERGGSVATGRAWILETFRSPVRTWSCDVILAEDVSAKPRPTLDSPGFNCLAVLTSNLSSDRVRLLNAGAEKSTGGFELTMNGRTLLVEVFQARNGEFIELLQILSTG